METILAAFYHLSMQFQPEMEIRERFLPLGDSEILHVKKCIHSLHGSVTGMKTFLHSFSASFKKLP